MNRCACANLRFAADSQRAPLAGIGDPPCPGAADRIFPPPHPHSQGPPPCSIGCALAASLAGLAALLIVAPLAVVSAADAAKKPTSVLDFHVKDIDGKDVDLARYKGKVLLDRQYGQPVRLDSPVQGPRGDLREVQGPRVRGPGLPGQRIRQAGARAPTRRSRSFARPSTRSASRSSRRSSSRARGSIRSTTSSRAKTTNPKFAGEIKWNFTKFLVNRKGEVIARFEPEKAFSKDIGTAVEKALAEKAQTEK